VREWVGVCVDVFVRWVWVGVYVGVCILVYVGV
jgi:hypothetical protein